MAFDTARFVFLKPIIYAIWLTHSFVILLLPYAHMGLGTTRTKSRILELFETHCRSRVSLELKRFKQVHTTRSSVYPSRGVVPCLFLPRVPFLLGTTTLQKKCHKQKKQWRSIQIVFTVGYCYGGTI